MSTLDTQLQNLKRQVDAAPWLKWAGAAIAVLLGAFILQSLDTLRVQRQKTAIETELNLRKILALKGQDIWFEREKSSVQLRDALQAQFPEVATSGMAQAALQTWLRTLTSGFDAQQDINLRVNRAGPVEGMPGFIRVNATVSGGLSPRQSLSLLRQIESSPNLVVVETITLQSDERSTLNLTLNAYYRVAPGSLP